MHTTHRIKKELSTCWSCSPPGKLQDLSDIEAKNNNNKNLYIHLVLDGAMPKLLAQVLF